MQAPRSSRPRIGITPDIEWRDEPSPVRAHYFLDTQLVDVLAQNGAAPLIVPHDESAIDELLAHIDGLVLSGGDWLFPHRHLVSGDGTEPPHKARRAHFEMALARAVLARDLPLLGICGGFQVPNAVTGGELIVSLSAERPDWH